MKRDTWIRLVKMSVVPILLLALLSLGSISTSGLAAPSKTATPNVCPGGIIDYVITLGSAATFDNVVVTDTLPAGVSYVAGSGVPAPTSVSDGTIEWDLGNAPGITDITFQGEADWELPDGTILTNVVQVTSTYQGVPIGPDSAEASTTVVTKGCAPEPGTPGFWKRQLRKNPGVVAGLLPVTLGDEEIATTGRALDILDGANAKDITEKLAASLLAAKLNVNNGVPSWCIDAVIADADAYLTAHPIGSDPSGSDRRDGVALHDQLDGFNNDGC